MGRQVSHSEMLGMSDVCFDTLHKDLATQEQRYVSLADVQGERHHRTQRALIWLAVVTSLAAIAAVVVPLLIAYWADSFEVSETTAKSYTFYFFSLLVSVYACIVAMKFLFESFWTLTKRVYDKVVGRLVVITNLFKGVKSFILSSQDRRTEPTIPTSTEGHAEEDIDYVSEEIMLKELLDIEPDEEIDERLRRRAAQCNRVATFDDIRRERDYRTLKAALKRATNPSGSRWSGRIFTVLMGTIAVLQFLNVDVRVAVEQAGISQMPSRVFPLIWDAVPYIWSFMFVAAVLYLFVIPELRLFGLSPKVISGLRLVAWGWAIGLGTYSTVVISAVLKYQYNLINISGEPFNEFINWIMGIGFFGIPLGVTVLFVAFVSLRKRYPQLVSLIPRI